MADSQKLAEAIAHGKAGRKELARQILSELVCDDPNDAEAWLWLSACFEDANKQRYCLNKALEIKPDLPQARKALDKLQARVGSARDDLTGKPTELASALSPSSQLSSHKSTSPKIDHSEGIPFYKAMFTAVLLPSENALLNLVRHPGASAGEGFIWVFAASLISFFIGLAINIPLIQNLLQENAFTNPQIANLGGNMMLAILCAAPIAAALSVVGIILTAGLYQIAARFLVGEGTFSEMVYILCAITAPLTLVSAGVSLLPTTVSGILGFALSIYTIYLTLIAIKAVHKMGWGGACLTSLAPALIFGTCMCLAVLVAMQFQP
jgi:hypothetical protein